MSLWLPICPKCGTLLICRTDGVCYCPTCQEVYMLKYKVNEVEYHADTA